MIEQTIIFIFIALSGIVVLVGAQENTNETVFMFSIGLGTIMCTIAFYGIMSSTGLT